MSDPSPRPQAPSPSRVKPTGFSCTACGYNLSGTTIGGICPECGVLVEHSLRKATATPRTSGHAITSLVLGILSLVLCALIGPIERIRERYRAWENCGVTGLTVFSSQPEGMELLAELAGTRDTALP